MQGIESYCRECSFYPKITSGEKRKIPVIPAITQNFAQPLGAAAANNTFVHWCISVLNSVWVQ